jgi:hypothetical protein
MSIGPPKTNFSNDDLVELEWVFASVCEALEATQGTQGDDVKACIRRRLFVLASNGISEPRSLRHSLIRSFTGPNKVLGARTAPV